MPGAGCENTRRIRAFSLRAVPAGGGLVCAPAVCAVSARGAHKLAHSAQAAELEHVARKRRLLNGPGLSGLDMPI
jgi:hypothetical protein